MAVIRDIPRDVSVAYMGRIRKSPIHVLVWTEAIIEAPPPHPGSGVRQYTLYRVGGETVHVNILVRKY
jgi:hypothetical protein